MSEKQRDIINRIAVLYDQIEDLQAHLTLIRGACEQLKRERDAAIQRAEKAEASLRKIADADIEANRFPTWKDLASEMTNIAREALGEEKETANV